jgi:hypothetical protein
VEDSSELVFAEFVESIARVAAMKWELKSMKFIDKLKLAIEAIVGCFPLISQDRRKELLPEVDWDTYVGGGKAKKPAHRPSQLGLPPISPISTGKLPSSQRGAVSPTHSVSSEASTASNASNASNASSYSVSSSNSRQVSIGTSWSSPVGRRKRQQPRRLPGFNSGSSSSSFSQQKHSHSRNCAVDERRTAMRGVTIEHVKPPPGGGKYFIATAGGSDQQLRYKHYLSSTRKGDWQKEGSTFSSSDTWHKGRWSNSGGGDSDRNLRTGVTLDPLGQDPLGLDPLGGTGSEAGDSGDGMAIGTGTDAAAAAGAPAEVGP